MAAPTIQATVRHSAKVSSTIMLLSLDMGQAFRFQSGQFVTVHVPPEPGTEKPLKGHYSVASAASVLPSLELLIEHHPAGPLSGYVSGWMAGLKEGQEIMLEGPYGRFGLPENPAPKNYFLGSGVGMAPLRGMILDLLGRKNGKQAWLFLGTDAPGELLLDAEWKALQSKNPAFHYVPVLMASGENPFFGKQADAADTLLRHVKERENLGLYLSGFNREVDPMLEKLQAAGFPKDIIKVEKFG